MSPDESAPARAAGVSKTAVWVAAARAIGAREPDTSVRNPDHLAAPLLGDASTLGLDHPVVEAMMKWSYDEAMRDFELAALVRATTVRTRFIGETLARAIAAGATQVLIPGAGFDSHAYRCRDLLARARVFEVDRPATQAFKRRRVQEALGGPPPNVTYVPVELGRDELAAALARHGYDPSERTFVIMEGLTMYLPEEALRGLFRFLAAHAPGSSVAFDFATQAMVEGLKHIDLRVVPPAARVSLERFLELTRDEPWLFGFPLGREQEYLAELGMELRELLTIGGEDSVERYLTKADGTTVGAEGHAQAEALREAAVAAAARDLPPELRRKVEEHVREQERQTAYRIAEAVVPVRSSRGVVR
ncbi:MAG TPA: SAM-dependent methyltransferase [Gammaproteobacteria bacterium]